MSTLPSTETTVPAPGRPARKKQSKAGRRGWIAVTVTVAVPMLLAGLVLSVVFFFATRLIVFPWYWAIPLVPVTYVVWLVLFLAFCAKSCASIGKRFPKPRFVVLGAGRADRAAKGGMFTVSICMNRRICMSCLPLLPWLERATGLRNLAMRAYAPSVHVADDAMVWGNISDPDLTEVGERVVIGNAVQVVAHFSSPRPDGTTVYASAPIKIGAYATIGGASYVAMGSVIGEGGRGTDVLRRAFHQYPRWRNLGRRAGAVPAQKGRRGRAGSVSQCRRSEHGRD